jgi:hypothetical protein
VSALLRELRKMGKINHKHLSMIYDRKGKGALSRVEAEVRLLADALERLEGESKARHEHFISEVDDVVRRSRAAGSTQSRNLDGGGGGTTAEVERLREKVRRLQKVAALDAGKHALHTAKKRQLTEALALLAATQDELGAAQLELHGLREEKSRGSATASDADGGGAAPRASAPAKAAAGRGAFRAGDRVEARWMGGSEPGLEGWYGAKVVSASPSRTGVTYSLLYDDGGEDDGVRESDVRATPGGRSSALPR